MELTETQREILRVIESGENVFMSGPGGCGKSFVIQNICDLTTKRNIRTTVTATTGCAAVLLGVSAMTLNSWSGVGLGTEPTSKIVKSIFMNAMKRSRWTDTDVLVIDEVSMLSKHMFDLLDSVGRAVRRNNKPFGGIQVVLSGDFYQLPPIGNDKIPNSECFCFESENWWKTFGGNQICLEKVFRQDGDLKYKKILNQVRIGGISRKNYEILLTCVNKVNTSDINPVKLYPRKRIVDDINKKENAKLPGQYHEYTVETYKMNVGSIRSPLKDLNEIRNVLNASSKNVEDVLLLKIGSHVMCTVNFDMESALQICNGSCGIVINFSETLMPVVKFHNGRVQTMEHYTIPVEIDEYKYEYAIVPLALSWAMTIHKSQGCSLDIAEIDVGSDTFEIGQTYVALSRVRSLNGLFLKAFDPNKIMSNKKVTQFYNKLKK